MKKLKLSASAISLFLRCPKAYYINYIDKVRQPTTNALKDGLKFHALIEDIFNGETDGKEYDPAILKMVTDAFENGVFDLEEESELLVEKKIIIDIDDECYMTGFCDLVSVTEDSVIIHDHKTIGNWKYAETGESLKKNLQLLIYGKWAIENFPIDEVTLRHNQVYKPDSTESKYVETIVSKDHINEFWDRKVVRAVKWIKTIRKQASAEDVKMRFEGCSAFGGCFYEKRGLCDGRV